MQIPVEAVAATALIEVVRITGLPAERGAAYPGATAHWTGDETADALALMGTLPGSVQHRCGFSPGWGIRAYGDSLDQALFEAAFCFTCHEVRMRGSGRSVVADDAVLRRGLRAGAGSPRALPLHGA
ncbi:hypothetical protein [Streptomyces sp. KL116D]|uniref:hypothetical protein n=1 Tax=Streptomyces sp. KL116D TaxID=3045152 RepID=UPI003557D5BB